MQWKENELADLDNDSITTKLWNDWGGFQKRFLENWEEIDSSGNMYTKLQKLQKRMFAPDQKQMSLIKYTKWFKELIRKAGVEGSSATYQFGQGLTLKEYKKIALTNPAKLEYWYEAAHCLFNIKNWNRVVTSTWSEWDMDVDIIAVNVMSKDEREWQVRNGLCFICHKDGHMSGECLNKKKGGLKKKDKGQHRGKGKKKKWFASGHHSRATDMESSASSDDEAEESQPLNEEMQIWALMKKLPKDQHLNMLISMEQDF